MIIVSDSQIVTPSPKLENPIPLAFDKSTSFRQHRTHSGV